MPWLVLGDEHLTDPEHRALASMGAVLASQDVGAITWTALDASAQPHTTIHLVSRPCENLAMIIRADGSVVIATDDIYAVRWRDER